MHTKIKECSSILYSLGKSIPVRVTHNDTKLNNILLVKNQAFYWSIFKYFIGQFSKQR